MGLNVAQVCIAKYPGQVEKLNITFVQEELGIAIDVWNVEGIERPTEAELLAQADEYQFAYDSIVFLQANEIFVLQSIDITAQSRGYKDGMYCSSYVQSTNLYWAAEAKAFISWRDLMYAYAFQIFSYVQNEKPIQTQEEFEAGFPKIMWP